MSFFYFMGTLTVRKFLHKLQSHGHILEFIFTSSCAVADNLLIKSESHSGSVNMLWMRTPVRFSARFSLCSAAGARAKEQRRCQSVRLSSAHTLIPTPSPTHTQALHHSTTEIIYISRLQIYRSGRDSPLNAEREEKGT